jgi:Ase1/PRC1/MAP65 family protein
MCLLASRTEGAQIPFIRVSYLFHDLSLLNSICCQMIWDEVGQDVNERERILEELEQECQEVYRRKVNSANMSRIQLHQALAESEAEFTNLLLSLGKRSFPGRVTSNILHVSS